MHSLNKCSLMAYRANTEYFSVTWSSMCIGQSVWIAERNDPMLWEKGRSYLTNWWMATEFVVDATVGVGVLFRRCFMLIAVTTFGVGEHYSCVVKSSGDIVDIL